MITTREAILPTQSDVTMTSPFQSYARLSSVIPILALLLLSTSPITSIIGFSPVLSSTGCIPQQSWSTSYPSTRSINPFLLNFEACQAITNYSGGDSQYLIGVDLLTGRRVWSYLFVSLSQGRFLPENPLTPSPSSPRLYLVDFGLQDGCRGIRAVTYSTSSGGLQLLWNHTLCGGDAVTDTATVLAFPFPASRTLSASLAVTREVVLLIDGDFNTSCWTSFDGATGAVLHQDLSMPVGGFYVRLMGNASDGRLLVLNSLGGSLVAALSYAVNSAGQWKLSANVTYDQSLWRFVPQDPGAEGHVGRVMPLENITHPDLWVGWDMWTGQRAWEVHGDPLYTGEWTANLTGFSAPFPPTTVPHPINSQWLMVTAIADNATAAFIYQYGIMDTATGKLFARSGVFAPQAEFHLQSMNLFWWAVGDDAIVTEEGGDESGQFWRAFDSTSLVVISSGPIPAEMSAAEHGYIGVDTGGASLWWTASNVINGTVLKAGAESLLLPQQLNVHLE